MFGLPELLEKCDPLHLGGFVVKGDRVQMLLPVLREIGPKLARFCQVQQPSGLVVKVSKAACAWGAWLLPLARCAIRVDEGVK